MRGWAQRRQVIHLRSHSNGLWANIKAYFVRPQFPRSLHMEKWERRPHGSRCGWAAPWTCCTDLRLIWSTHKDQLGPAYRPTAWRDPEKKQAGLIPRAGSARHLHARLDVVPRRWVQGMAWEMGSCVKRPGRDS